MASNKEIAALIIDHVRSCVATGAIPEEYNESMDVVIGCLSDAFEVDAEDASNVVKAKFGGKKLADLVGSAESAPSGATETKSETGAAVPVHILASETELKAKAEALKSEGNKAIAAKKFDEAIAKYTEAIEIVPTNAVYYSNRAAAYSSAGQHGLAIKDAKHAIELDPTYARAYSRLGLANYALGDTQAAVDAYQKGIEIEGDNVSPGMKKGYETAKKKLEAEQARSVSEQPEAASLGMPDLASMMGALGGGAGGAGGMDFASMMNNPQIMQSVQGLMQNPQALASLMNNPMMQQMAQNLGLGGQGGQGEGAGQGGPNLEELMNNPMLRNMANQFMGGRNNGSS